MFRRKVLREETILRKAARILQTGKRRRIRIMSRLKKRPVRHLDLQLQNEKNGRYAAW